MADEAVVGRLMAAKKASGKSYSQIAAETGLTNVYVAQLLHRQAQLKPATALALRSALPTLTDGLVSEMMNPPFRSYRPNLIQEPAIYRYVTQSPIFFPLILWILLSILSFLGSFG